MDLRAPGEIGMTPSTQSPGEGELIARLQKQLADFDAGREVYCPCFAHEAILIPAESLRALTERVARMEEELRHAPSTWPISLDGAHKPGNHRVWLARQLLDSKLTDKEAFGVVCYSPAVSDLWKARLDTN